MKQRLLVLGALFFVTGLLAQRVKPAALPAAVLEHFEKQFVGAKEAKWEKEGVYYEVEFEVGELEQSAVFDAAGNLIETEVDIAYTSLPAAVKEYLRATYGKAKIKEVTQITDNKGSITYEVEVKGRDVLFDEKGQFLREVVILHED